MVHLFLGDHPASRRLVSLISPVVTDRARRCPAMPLTPCKHRPVLKAGEPAGRLRMVASSPHVRGKVQYARTPRALRETIRSTLSPPSMELWLGTRQAIRDHTVTGRPSRYQPSTNPPHPKNPPGQREGPPSLPRWRAVAGERETDTVRRRRGTRHRCRGAVASPYWSSLPLGRPPDEANVNNGTGLVECPVP